MEVYEATEGSFDPTVMPLVNYWGFGYAGEPITRVDSNKVDSLVQFVGFEKVIFEALALKKDRPGVQLDFSACAKGYGVDEVGRFLETQGCNNYLVEIGGEVRARGINQRSKNWQIGINTPQEGGALDDYQAIVKLKDLSLATSGNYRNFYELNGVKYSHTINPKTGFPERNTLLSASVFAKDCMTADAYATAFMASGLDKAFDVALQNSEIDAYLIYSDEDGQMQVKYTEAVAGYLIE